MRLTIETIRYRDRFEWTMASCVMDEHFVTNLMIQNSLEFQVELLER